MTERAHPALPRVISLFVMRRMLCYACAPGSLKLRVFRDLIPCVGKEKA
jgi:hypothetical protein